MSRRIAPEDMPPLPDDLALVLTEIGREPVPEEIIGLARQLQDALANARVPEKKPAPNVAQRAGATSRS